MGRNRRVPDVTIAEFEAMLEVVEGDAWDPSAETDMAHGMHAPEWRIVCLSCFLDDCIDVTDPRCPLRITFKANCTPADAAAAVETVREVTALLPATQEGQIALLKYIMK